MTRLSSAFPGFSALSVFTRALPLSVACLAGLACSAPPPAQSDEAAGSSAEALSLGEYGYFFAEARGAHGYAVLPANGARVACGGAVTDACPVASVDLTALGTSDADSASLLAVLNGRDARSLVFV